MIKEGKEFYKVKWENYEEPTWEPKTHIPEFITNYFDKSGQSKIPSARVSHTKTVGMVVIFKVHYYKLLNVGGSKFHLLVWDDPSGEMYWEEDSAFSIEDSAIEMFACNTRKVVPFYYIVNVYIDIFKRTQTREYADIHLVSFLVVGHVA